MRPSLSAVVTRALLSALSLLAATVPARAWVYPEHRDIAVEGVRTLDSERSAHFQRLWTEARGGHEQRLCEQAADAGQGVAPACIDWAAFAAIAGDHSCSSSNMLANVLDSAWILQVADVSAQLKLDIGRIAVTPRPEVRIGERMTGDIQRLLEDQELRSQRLNALRTADTRLQRADPQYATRAGSNNAHFLIPRPRTDTTPHQYAELALQPGSELNAIGIYAWFHVSALQKATRLASEQLAPAQRQRLARAMLADEGFALHFLQDSFAAGHVAGAWGDVSARKGTHDHYNEFGLEAFTWRGGSRSVVLMGDAHIRREDVERAAAAVRASLEQLIDHASGRPAAARLPHAPAAPDQADSLDVCRTSTFTPRDEGQRAGVEAVALAAEVLGATPIPGLGPGLGALPRFRAEVGPFVGVTGALDARGIDGAYDPGLTANGLVGGAELSLRAGFGLEGVLGDSGDGLVFASIGLRGDSRSTSRHGVSSPLLDAANGVAAMPQRFAITTRLRMPFYLLPGDLLLLSPLYFFDPETYTRMAVTASNGGLVPWQAGWSTRFGRFQFVLGRELGMTFYGYGFENKVVVPGATPLAEGRLLDVKSIHFDLPILEYRPYRAFDTKQSSAVLMQLFVGADVPQSSSVAFPAGAPGARLETVYSIGLRLIFDWRRYF